MEVSTPAFGSLDVAILHQGQLTIESRAAALIKVTQKGFANHMREIHHFPAKNTRPPHVGSASPKRSINRLNVNDDTSRVLLCERLEQILFNPGHIRQP